jgi:hypothetical protein
MQEPFTTSSQHLSPCPRKKVELIITNIKEVVMRSHFILYILSIALALLSFHCSITQPVRVLDKGATQLTGSLGGPFIPLGSTTIPVPYLNIGLIHGYSETMTLSGNLHLLPILFGDMGLDGGIATSLVKQKEMIPEVTGKAMVMMFSDFRTGAHPRIYPLISFNASYLVRNSDLVYIGADNVFQASTPHYLFTPFIGFQFPLGNSWTGQIETKWMAANIYTARGILEGQTNISNYGNTSIFFGLLYSL